MKVICIDDKPRFEVREGVPFVIEVGEKYHVVEVDNHPVYGESYALTVQPEYTYPSYHFATTSNICETEFSRNYKKELVNQTP